ncbi:MAG: hypothetical protein AAF126_25475, partial [Chloroflexota bacterium]
MSESTSEDLQLHFSGNSSTTGPNGNVRSFTAGDVAVDVSAFSSDLYGNHFQTAYLGLYGSGLGVTN